MGLVSSELLLVGPGRLIQDLVDVDGTVWICNPAKFDEERPRSTLTELLNTCVGLGRFVRVERVYEVACVYVKRRLHEFFGGPISIKCPDETLDVG